jgi:hypothetical protein
MMMAIKLLRLISRDESGDSSLEATHSVVDASVRLMCMVDDRS